MKIFTKFIVLLIFTLAVIPDVHSTLYFVKPGGANGSAGTSWATAWATISHAATNADQPGDIVIVSNGTYNENIIMQHSGTAGNPIIFRSLEKGKAVVDANGANYAFDLDNIDYIRIDGFEIKNTAINA
ncbi:MAG: hypothetical protein JW860_03960, partial [Sedimentisphaerales bacterium]|nr:hypothetical protein [Sedimentisphaerales bacterium]